MKVTLKIWRQSSPDAQGAFETFADVPVQPEMSFLEMLDTINARLEAEGKEPIAFDHDCREGICGSCGAVVNGMAHGPGDRSTLCQLHLRSFRDGDEILVEPWRADAFPVVKDLMVDRSSFDRIIMAGGYVSVRTGSAPDGNTMPIGKPIADRAFESATCIGCGACVAACPNASAMLFTAAKVTHLGLLPQGQAERDQRVLRMVQTMDEEGFGGCTNHRECEAACPKGIGVDNIAQLNRDLVRANLGTSAAK